MIIEKPSDERHFDDAELASIIRRKIAVAEEASGEGNFEGAGRAFKEAAEASFALGDFEGAMRLLDRQEDASNKRISLGPRIENYLSALQAKVDKATKAGKHGQARDLLKQMLAIAEQGRDVPAVKAIKQQLAELQVVSARKK